MCRTHAVRKKVSVFLRAIGTLLVVLLHTSFSVATPFGSRAHCCLVGVFHRIIFFDAAVLSAWH
jgi:hypothetical protein